MKKVVIVMMIFCVVFATNIENRAMADNSDNLLTAPIELQTTLENFESDVDFMESYADDILSVEDVILPDLSEFETSVIYNRLGENVPEHQRLARNNARVWLYNIYPQLFETIGLMIDYAEEFDEASQKLYTLLPDIENNDQVRGEFINVLYELLENIEEKQPLVNDVVANLQDLRSKVSKDASNFNGNKGDAQNVLAGADEVVDTLRKELNDTKSEYENKKWQCIITPWGLDTILQICKSADKLESLIEFLEYKLTTLESQLETIATVADELEEIFELFSNTARKLEMDLVNGWINLGSKIGVLIKSLERVNPDFPLLLESNLNIAVDSWRVLKVRAESLQALEEPRDRPDPPRPPEELGLFYVTTSAIGIEWADSDIAEEIVAWEIYRDGQFVGEVDEKITQYKEEDLFSNQTYTYHVVARSVIGDRSEGSKELSFTTRSLYPPNNIRETSKTETTSTLEWNPSPAFEGMTVEYDIYQFDDLGDHFLKLIGTTTETKYTIEGLDPSTEYVFTVKAREGIRSSTFDDAVITQTGN